MSARAARAYHIACYYVSWGWFGLFALGFNLVCIPLLPLRSGPAVGVRVRAVLQRLFALWQFWLRLCGVVRVTWTGFDQPLPTGTVYVANHPTLVDAPFLLSRLPDTICVMKPSLARNPFIAPAALTAGYVISDKLVDAVREVAGKLGTGSSLLIFPEGTRTQQGAAPGPFKSAFFLSVERSRAPIQLIVIRSSPQLAAKGHSWWRPPHPLPGAVHFTLDRRWDWREGRSSAELIAEVERRMIAVLEEKT